VAAMRDWSRLTAGPPRSYEWAPATGRALGLLGPGPVRWEREHPRWPSAGTVAHHFGSFGAGLEAAGFRLPPRSELPAHEAAAAARRLASTGLSTRAIAVELGVAWATADGYLRGGDCPVCGRPKAKPTSRTCRSCRASMRGMPPRSRDEIVELLRAWRSETGSAPRIAEWRPGGHPKWDREQPRWPGGQAVARAFGGRWTRALAEAGVGPVRERHVWTDERIVAALEDWADANGDAPTQKKWEAARSVPSASTIRRHFGSWADALDAAGFDTRSRS
jgi:hypothetical protein